MSWPLGEPGGKKVLEKSSQGTSPSECGKGLPSLLTRAGGQIGAWGGGGQGCRGARAPQFHHPPGWSPWLHPWGANQRARHLPESSSPSWPALTVPKPFLTSRHLLPYNAFILPLGRPHVSPLLPRKTSPCLMDHSLQLLEGEVSLAFLPLLPSPSSILFLSKI